MVNRQGNFCAGAIYFAFEQGNALMQFGNGERIEILPQQQGERIIRAFWNILVHIHGGDC